MEEIVGFQDDDDDDDDNASDTESEQETNDDKPNRRNEKKPPKPTLPASHFTGELDKVFQSGSDISTKVKGLTKITKEVGKSIQWRNESFASSSVPISSGTDDQKKSLNTIIEEFHGLSPVDCFENYFDEEVQQLIIRETNRYARTKHADHLFSLEQEYLKIFIGVLIFSGYHHLPRQRLYWDTILFCRLHTWSRTLPSRLDLYPTVRATSFIIFEVC